MPQPPLSVPNTALFLDFDGTLVELQPHPEAVVVSPGLVNTLERAQTRLGGALAVISGRSIASLDARLAPLRLPVAGIHGLERRAADGSRHTSAAAQRALEPVRPAISAFAAARPGVLAEDKGLAIALHYRRAPEQAEAVRDFMTELHRRIGDSARLQHGKAVVELVGGDGDKGDAIDAFLAETPFAGRRPVYIGDDVTDEAAFARVNARDGISIHVGPADETCARQRLPSVQAVCEWLVALADPEAAGIDRSSV